MSEKVSMQNNHRSKYFFSLRHVNYIKNMVYLTGGSVFLFSTVDVNKHCYQYLNANMAYYKNQFTINQTYIYYMNKIDTNKLSKSYSKIYKHPTNDSYFRKSDENSAETSLSIFAISWRLFS